jgi:hypothetical protein
MQRYLLSGQVRRDSQRSIVEGGLAVEVHEGRALAGGHLLHHREARLPHPRAATRKAMPVEVRGFVGSEQLFSAALGETWWRIDHPP